MWISPKPLITRQYFFHYKYAVVNNDDYVIRWERGVDRCADLEIMPENCVTSEYQNPTEYFYHMEVDH